MEDYPSEGRARKRPFFSVVIPTFNRRRRVIRAIKSVLKQTCQDFEIIVVDDGSTDGTGRKIKQKFGSKVRYFYQSNQGPSASRNYGIRQARGEYIAFLDSDDQFLPDKLRHNKRYLLRHPETKFLYSWYYDLRGKKKKKIRKPKNCKSLNHFRHSLYRRKFTIRTSTVVVHRSCFQKAGGFQRGYRYSQDWDMWLRLAARYLGRCQKKPLSIYFRARKKRNHRKIRRYHRQIRWTARKLYHWSRKKIRKLDRKYGKK